MSDPSDPTFIDNSTMSAVARCSTEGLMRYGLDYTTIDESALLLSGQAGHEAMAIWLKGGTKDEALAAFEELYAPWAAEHISFDDRLSFDNCALILDTWFDRHPLDKFPFIIAPDLVEVGFSVPLDPRGEFIFTGRCDFLPRDRDTHSLYVCDTKFTGRIDRTWARKFRLSSQLIGYAWATSETLGEEVTGAYINAVELSRLPSDPGRRCKDHATPYSECGFLHTRHELIGPIPITPADKANWLRSARRLARKFRDLRERFDLATIDAVPQEGFFNNSCQWCSFSDFCMSGRQPSLASSMLVIDRWRPWEAAEAVAKTIASAKGTTHEHSDHVNVE